MMKLKELKGWQKVFAFTFMQTIKGKSILISTLIMCLVTAFAFPLMQSLTGQGDISLKKLYIQNETSYNLDKMEEYVKNTEGFEKVKVVVSSENQKSLEEKLKKNEMIIRISQEQTGFILKHIKSKDSGIKQVELANISTQMSSIFTKALTEGLGIDKAQVDYMNAPIETSVEVANEEGEVKQEQEDLLSEIEYNAFFAVAFATMMFIMLSSEVIANSIITEKSTRVIEYLIISVRPLAIIFGKILASLCVTCLQLLSVGVFALISKSVSSLLSKGEDVNVSNALAAVGELKESFITPSSVVIGILVLLLGFLFFATIAAMSGASISKVEESAEGMKIISILLVIGVYLGLGMAMTAKSGGELGMIGYLSCLLPIASPFSVPFLLIVGKIKVGLAIASVAILLVSQLLLSFLVSNVYEGMILHRGERLKIKDILGMAKQKKGKRGGEVNE